jgi:large conductance mechanosensitive channel
MLKGFRDFILRGNVVELAVAFVMGVAFTSVVRAFSDDFIGSLIRALGGQHDFNALNFKVNGEPVVYGTVITALIGFVMVAAVVYFLIVVPMNALAERREQGDEDAPPPPEDIQLLTEIRDLLKK